MAKQRKIKCDCGEILVEKKVKLEDFYTEAMVCPSCNFTTLTKEQAKKYAGLRQMHHIIDAKRKIIKIGNSMGLTLPEKLQVFGICIGKEVRIEALSAKSFKVELVG